MPVVRNNSEGLAVLTVIGVTICSGTVETISDTQLQRIKPFMKDFNLEVVNDKDTPKINDVPKISDIPNIENKEPESSKFDSSNEVEKVEEVNPNVQEDIIEDVPEISEVIVDDISKDVLDEEFESPSDIIEE